MGSFDEYVVSRWPRLVRAAVLLGSDVQAAEDLVQTTLTRCCLSWERISRTQDPDAYVHRMLVNARHDSRRRRWWGERPTEHLPDLPGEDPTHRLLAEDAVRRALARLPAGQRQVVVLRFYADLTEPQVAEVLGIALGTVKSRTARALSALQDDPDLAELTTGGTP